MRAPHANATRCSDGAGAGAIATSAADGVVSVLRLCEGGRLVPIAQSPAAKAMDARFEASGEAVDAGHEAFPAFQ